MRLAALLLLTIVTLPAVAPPAAAQAPPEVTLEGRAVLPADTFAPGPPSGTQLPPNQAINGRTPPFPSQPVQGFSAVLRADDGGYLAMPDNGFGAKDNSADFLLRAYRIEPRFETTRGGAGTIEVGDFIELRDPDRKIDFPIVNASGERLLTGADFDIESMRRDRRGDLWFGDEFGPFLLHTDATGRVREAPIALPGVKSPQNPTLAPGEQPTLPRSSGFEGTALSKSRRYLYASLEGALIGDPDQRRRYIHTFDLRAGEYNDTPLQYRVEAPGNVIGDLTAIDSDRLLLIERDNLQGPAARFKRIYEVDITETGAEGFVSKRLVADLLQIRDPAGISLPARAGDFGLGDPFLFPFQTIESVLPIGDRRLLILNDNNYPFSAGRNPGRPDDNEAIVVHVPGLTDSE